MKLFLKVISLSFFVGSTHSFAETEQAELTVGVNFSFDFQSYKGRQIENSVLPTVFYDGDLFYAEGDQAGVNLLHNAKNQLRLYAYYDGTMYSPHGELSQLDTRKWSVLAGTSYMYTSEYGALKLSAAHDVLSRSRGAIANMSYIAEWESGPWTVYPELGLQWNNARYNQYYFGVSPMESERSGIAAYKLGSSIHPYANLIVDYRLSRRWDVYTTYGVSYLSNNQYQSPMSKKRWAFEPALGINYTF